MKALEEENPALGWRAIRIGLDRPALLRIQMRAMLRAGAGRRSAAHAADGLDRRRIQTRRARCSTGSWRFCARIGRDAADLGRSSASWSRCPRCCGSSTRSPPRADFLSVGSNDLMQYLYAADRDNKRVVEPLRPAVAGLPARAESDRRRSASAAIAPVTLCGEIGGRPLEAMALIALGYPRPVDVGDRDRPDQGDDAVAAARRGARRGRCAARRRAAIAPRCASRCARSPSGTASGSSVPR